MAFIKKLIDIKKGEGRPVLFLYIFFFFYMAANITGSTARDAYFLNLFDRSYLPLMFVVVAIMVTVFIALYKRLTANIDLIHTITITVAIFIGSLALIQFNLKGWVIPFLYVWMEIIAITVLAQFWLLAGDIFDPRQAKRLFGLLGGGASLSAIIVGISIKPFVETFGSGNLLYTTMGFLAITILMAWILWPYRKSNGMVEQKKAPVKKDKKQHFFDSYLTSIAIIAGSAVFVTQIVSYQFKMTAVNTIPAQDNLVNFFGMYYVLIGVSVLGLQFFVIGPLLSRFGILVGLLVLPLAITMGSAVYLLNPILTSAFIAKFLSQVLKFSLHNPSMQLLWLPVPFFTKQQVKPVIEGSMMAIIQGLTGILIFVGVKYIPMHWLSILIIGVAIPWVVSIFRIKARYVSYLKSAIEKRQLDFQELEVDITIPAIVESIEKPLSSDDEIDQLFALELIKDMSLKPWKSSINRLLEKGSPLVQQTILKLTADEPDVVEDHLILNYISRQSELSAEAIQVAGNRQLNSALPLLEQNLEAEDRKVRAAAADAIVTLGNGPTEKARSLLASLLCSEHEADISLALQHMAYHRELIKAHDLLRCLTHPSPEVRTHALSIPWISNERDLIPEIVQNLESPKTAPAARAALSVFPEKDVMDIISEKEPATLSPSLKLGILRLLKEYSSDKAVHVCLSFMDHHSIPLFDKAVDSLLAIGRKRKLSESTYERISEEIWFIAKLIYELYQFQSLIPKDHRESLLFTTIEDDIYNILPIALKLGVLNTPDTPIETYIHTVLSGDVSRLPFVLELFENIFSRDVCKLITPLIESLALEEKTKRGRLFFPHMPQDIRSFLSEFLVSTDPWRSVLALDYVLRTDLFTLLKETMAEVQVHSPYHQELLTKAVNEKGLDIQTILPSNLNYHKELSMYTTLEKTLLLKSVTIFRSIPARQLAQIAQIAEEMHVPPYTELFHKGDYGDSLYIIVSGSVRIHQGKKDIALLEKGDCLGEMALLDQESRSADATIEEKSTLLKINQEGFYELMSGEIEIMKGIMKLLTGRLREAIK